MSGKDNQYGRSRWNPSIPTKEPARKVLVSPAKATKIIVWYKKYVKENKTNILDESIVSMLLYYFPELRSFVDAQ